jgi:hypothetical protein
LNNWKVAGHIFLGFGSVFLGIALIALLSIIDFNPTSFDLSSVALVASAPCFLAPKIFFGELTIMQSEQSESASTRIGVCFCEETD